MENENHIGTVDNSYNYLQKDEFQRHFADLNIELLRGGHIQDDNYYLFDLLRKFPNELNHYYKSFYNLELAKETKDNTTFYYLDFIGEITSVSKTKSGLCRRAQTRYPTPGRLHCHDRPKGETS